MELDHREGQKNLQFLFLINILVVVLVSSNLRSPITAVGPVLYQINEALNLNNFQSSLITSIPLIMFATTSIFISKYAQKVNITRFLFYAILILSIGMFLRIGNSIPSLFLGSILVGLGIAIANVILPGYIKKHFANHIGLMTGIFAVSMNIGAAIAAKYSFNLSDNSIYGWKASLGFWVILSLIALIVIGLELIGNKKEIYKKKEQIKITKQLNFFKSKQAWNISLLMGGQSAIFYAIVTWLPIVLVHYGMQESETGTVLFVFQLATIPITFIGPIIANKMKDQRLMILFLTIILLVGILLILFYQIQYILLAVALIGTAIGLAFSLSVLFFSLRTQNNENAISISGMSQSIGYIIGAAGPIIFAKLNDFDPSWNLSFYFLLATVSIIFYFGMKAARDVYVEEH